MLPSILPVNRLIMQAKVIVSLRHDIGLYAQGSVSVKSIIALPWAMPFQTIIAFALGHRSCRWLMALPWDIAFYRDLMSLSWDVSLH